MSQEDSPHSWMIGRVFVVTRDVFNVDRSWGVGKGQPVKVTMISEFGDVGITRDLTKDAGYAIRVSPNDLESLHDHDCLIADLKAERNHLKKQVTKWQKAYVDLSMKRDEMEEKLRNILDGEIDSK